MPHLLYIWRYGLPGRVQTLRNIPHAPPSALLGSNHSNQPLGESSQFSDSQQGPGWAASVFPVGANSAPVAWWGLLFTWLWCNHNAQNRCSLTGLRKDMCTAPLNVGKSWVARSRSWVAVSGMLPWRARNLGRGTGLLVKGLGCSSNTSAHA